LRAILLRPPNVLPALLIRAALFFDMPLRRSARYALCLLV
jgi:hypothetical protein